MTRPLWHLGAETETSGHSYPLLYLTSAFLDTRPFIHGVGVEGILTEIYKEFGLVRSPQPPDVPSLLAIAPLPPAQAAMRCSA